MTTIDCSKLVFFTFVQSLINGLTTLADADGVQAQGTTYTRAQMLAPLLACVVLPPKTKAAKTAYSGALAAENAALAEARAMVVDVVEPYLRTSFGKDSAALETFGLTPQKPAQKSAAVKAGAAKKAASTRKALGTKGPRQKKAAMQEAAAAPAPVPPAKS